jgi:hydrocephalus-inducing protein
MNSSVLRITNNGKYDADLEFALSSSVLEGSDIKKGVFLFEPEKVNLKMEQTEEIRVWAFPDAVQKFKDDLICMINNNPMPAIFKLQCDGVKPVVEVSSENIFFDRLLLRQSVTQQLKIKNICAIPVKWKLNGVEALPKDEFRIENTNGLLKPCQDTIVEITFTAVK